jgi:hypothetical protein
VSGERDRVAAHLLPQFGGQVRRRRQFDDFLMAALHAAIALVEVNHVAVGVGQDLHLYVPWAQHRLFQVHRRIPERRFGLPTGCLDRFGQRGAVADSAHTAAAAAGDRLDEQRKPHAL